MSVQSIKKRNGCTLATAHKKFQHTLAGAEKSVKYRVWPGRNKTYFYHTKRRQTQKFAGQSIHKICWIAGQTTPITLFLRPCQIQLANFRAVGWIKDIDLKLFFLFLISYQIS